MAAEYYFNPRLNFKPDGANNPDRKKFISPTKLRPRKYILPDGSDAPAEFEVEDEEEGTQATSESGPNHKEQ